MHHFSVWAPRRSKVSLKLADKTLPMHGPSSRGFWSLDVADAGHGTDYAFLLDDDPMSYPDPRSFWQPKDVHSPSRVYDHHRFPWTDEKFRAIPLPSAVLYELHLGTFTPGGTFDSAIEKLDYLCELGITHLEILPVAGYEGNWSWGYDGVAPYAVDESFGGPDAAKRFIDAAHAKGLAVVLDVVYNHFGPAGNYTNQFGPYYTEKHVTPWGAAINFEEGGSDQVRRYFIDNALMWLRDYHFDGLRLDATHELIDRSAMHILEQLAREVEDLSASVGRCLTLIAESDLNNPRVVTSLEANGFGMDAQWSDDFHHALFSLLEKEHVGYFEDFGTVEDLAHTLKHTFPLRGPVLQVSPQAPWPSGHEPVVPQVRRLHSEPRPDRQSGQGVSVCNTSSAHARRGLPSASCLPPPSCPCSSWAKSGPRPRHGCTSPDFQEESLRKAVSEGRKRDFASFGFGDDVPDPEDPKTFQDSKLNWDELQQPEHHAMYRWYRDLIHLRRKTLALNLGDMSRMAVHCNEAGRWIATDRGDVRTVINFAEEFTRFDLPTGSDLLLSSDASPDRVDGGVLVPPLSMAVYRMPPRPQYSEPPQ